MGSVNKGLLPFRGKPMIEHVLERLAPQVDELIINANSDIEAYASFVYPVFADTFTGFAGPLAGLHSGMQAAQHPFIVTAPCDSPLLPANLVQRLAAALEKEGADVAMARTEAHTHPVFCLCRCTLLPALTAFLQNGGRKVDAWFATLHTIEVAFDDEVQAFANINTPGELARMEHPT